MSELSSEAREFVLAAAQAESRTGLSPTERAELRRQLAVRLDGSNTDAVLEMGTWYERRPRGTARIRVAAIAAVALLVGAPAWASAGIWFALGVGTGATVVMTYEFAVSSSSRMSLQGSVPLPAVVASGAPRSTAPSSQIENAVGSPIDSTPVESARVPSSSRGASPPHAANSGLARATGDESTLGAEAALIRAAEQAIHDREGGRAIGLLDEHARRFPDGTLVMEASAARVIANCEFVDHPRGLELLVEFERRWPNTPYRARLAASCEAK